MTICERGMCAPFGPAQGIQRMQPGLHCIHRQCLSRRLQVHSGGSGWCVMRHWCCWVCFTGARWDEGGVAVGSHWLHPSRCRQLHLLCSSCSFIIGGRHCPASLRHFDFIIWPSACMALRLLRLLSDSLQSGQPPSYRSIVPGILYLVVYRLVVVWDTGAGTAASTPKIQFPDMD